ncbi:MAG: ATP-binding protein [Gammaproteobacteria bacterium]
MKISLRSKLMLISISVLIIPYIGFENIKQTETYLRSTLETSLANESTVIASRLNDEPSFFRTSFSKEKDALYVHKLNNNSIQIDGYISDWRSYLKWSRSFESISLTNKDNFRLFLSEDDNFSKEKKFYNILLQIEDDHLIYRTPESNKINGDHVTLVYRDKYEVLKKIYISPITQGVILPFSYEKKLNQDTQIMEKKEKPLTNLKSIIQKTDKGFNIEVKIPHYMIGNNLGFIFNDYDIRGGGKKIIRTFAGREPNRIVRTSKDIEDKIPDHIDKRGKRIWVLDKHGLVLASIGSLKQEFKENVFNILYTYLLPPAYDQFEDDLAGASQLKGPEVESALKGVQETKWRSSPDNRAVIVSAATPIYFDREIVGVVVVEETTNNIQFMQRQVLSNIFDKTLFILVFIVFLLLIFASRLSSRLIKLNRDATGAIDEYGKVQRKFSASNSSDEIGELSRSFSNMLERLDQYHNYLEGMVSRLSHELATPMAIVKSSLDRMQKESNEDDKRDALKAAETGLNRLQNLLTRLSEAARIEQALQESDKQNIVMNTFLKKCVDGYKYAYPHQVFKLNPSRIHFEMKINPDLFYQMLDKLISNAVDFSDSTKPIVVNLDYNSNKLIIEVINYGPPLPKNMTSELFNSMVSVPGSRTDAGPHLGLGLFVARLIAEFHGGFITANNLENGNGVCFRIQI